MRNCILIIILIITINPGLSAQQTYKIVGTGVTKCYNNSNVITCPSNKTDAFYGQYQGIAPSYKNNGDGTITDQNTGLMWIGERGAKVTWDSAFIMAKKCSIGGYNDWRVPTIKELYSLIDFNGKSGATDAQCIPYIDTDKFEIIFGDVTGGRVIDGQDWSATKYTALTMAGDSTVFGVNFIDGRIKGYPQFVPGTGNATKNKMYVRFVRSNITYGKNDFQDNEDNTITDKATGLMWNKDDSKTGMNWQEALAWVQTKNTENYLGHNDWRLPFAKELQSILDYTRSPHATNSAAIDPKFNCTSITDEGGNTDWAYYWTSTTHLDNNGAVYLSFGAALGYMKMPPTASYYTLVDVHGAGAQRSDPKSGNATDYYLGVDKNGNAVYGRGPQGDVQRINNFVRLVRTVDDGTGLNNANPLDKEININIYPNPFSTNTKLEYKLPYKTNVEISVYDILGNKIKTIVNQVKDKGSYTIELSGEIFKQEGIYLYSLKTSDYIVNGKLIYYKK